jgi:hypothetical protein
VRSQRLSSPLRGWIIGVLLAFYGWFTRQPGESLAVLLLVGAAMQLAVIVIRRIVPPDRQAEAFQVYELVADGVTVLLFALGVFGGIASTTTGL